MRLRPAGSDRGRRTAAVRRVEDVEDEVQTAAFGGRAILASPALSPHGGCVSHSGPETGELYPSFSDLRFDRVCRTPQSEAYLLSEGDSPFGRVDLHFGASVVHGVLIIEREL